NCTSVVIDNRDGMRQVLQYLHELGHRTIAYLSGEPDELTSQHRLAALREYAHLMGFRVPEHLIVERRPHESVARQVERLLAKERSYTAVVCFNDVTAYALLAQLRQRGLDVPGDVSITGFDNLPASEVTH